MSPIAVTSPGTSPGRVPTVDPEALRAEVRTKYAEVATNPHGTFHFHTGRPLAVKLGYPTQVTDTVPESALESFAGVDNPFAGGSIDEWTDAIAAAGFTDIAVGLPTDSFGGAAGETRAREYAVTGHTFRAVAS